MAPLQKASGDVTFMFVKESILVEEKDEGSRIDVHLARILLERFSRSRIKKLIEEGAVTVDGRKVSAHYRVKRNEKIEIELPDHVQEETRAEDIPIEIISEDEDLILVNKPAGMVVHPACGNPQHTLVNALLFHTRGLSGLGGNIRPGIVHRLDKDSSGIMVVAKSDVAHAFLARQFKQHTVERVYRVAVKGVVQHDEGIVEEPVGRAFLNRKKVIVKPSGGKEATTYFRVLRRFKNGSLLEVRPQTGRTHQIRVHMAHMGHPVLGDSFYGVVSEWIPRQAVHALSIGFVHPRSKEKVFYETNLPHDFQELLARLGT